MGGVKIPDWWFIWLVAGFLSLGWIFAEVDRTGHRFETPVWQRVAVVGVVLVGIWLVQRRTR
jgi:hypothetical protein